MAVDQDELDRCHEQGLEDGDQIRPLSGPWGHAFESAEDWETRNDEYERGKRDSSN